MFDPDVYVVVFGQTRILESGRLVQMSRLKDRALLAFLAVNRPKQFRRDYLANLLWPDSSERAARQSLAQSIYEIRRILPAALEATRHYVTAGRTVHCQIDELTTADDRRIRDFLERIDGEFLDDMSLIDGEEFSEWRDTTSAQLAVIIDEQRKRLFRSFPYLQEVNDFTGTSPMIREALSAVTRQDPSDGDARRIPNPSAQSFTVPFSGREVQLRSLNEALEAASDGKPQFVVITGRAGYGKTRLVQEFIAQALKADIQVFKSRCYEAEKRVGYGPISEILSHQAMLDHSTLLHPHFQRALAAVASRTMLLSGDAHGITSPTTVLEAFARLVREIARDRPCLLWIDDIQWLDDSTRAVLSYVSRRLDREKLIVVCCTRVSGPAQGLREPFSSWNKIGVEELSLREIAEIVSQFAANHDVDVDRVSALSGGHPYIVAAILRAEAFGERRTDIVVESIDSLLASILKSLPPPAQRLVATLSILGRPANISLLRSLCRTDRLLVLLDLLRDRGIITLSNGTIHFRHDLVRETAYRRIPTFTRQGLHKRCASVLSKQAGNEGEAALHYFEAGINAKAHSLALEAAALADRRHASEEAIFFLQLAGRAIPSQSSERRYELARRLYDAWRLSEALDETNRALSDIDPSDPNATSLVVLQNELSFELGQRDALKTFERAALLPNDGSTKEQRFSVMRLTIRCAFHSAQAHSMSKIANELRDLYELEGPTTIGIAAITLAIRGIVLSDSVFKARAWIDALLGKTHGLLPTPDQLTISELLAVVEYAEGHLGAASATCEKAIIEAEEIGAMEHWISIMTILHMLAVEQGHYDAAKQLANRMRKYAKTIESNRLLTTLVGNEAAMLFAMGEFDGTVDACQSVLDSYRYGSIPLSVPLLALSGLAHLECGRFSKAAELANDLGRTLDRTSPCVGEVSYANLLISRVLTRNQKHSEAEKRLVNAIQVLNERDRVARLRLQLELARLLKRSKPAESRMLAKTLFAEACECNARPIAESTDALLLRL